MTILTRREELIAIPRVKKFYKPTGQRSRRP
ncbi:hypothetical protein APX70_200067 [Pseudomonas syringae pv. maculicola]|uniref:Uncharacterized protein n=1 Tax=Pseudomonas syringae pv. maculicola TaxID=59511 RepID=A0A3M3ABW7_PSEYM|nr:hypothetical protein APX70_200067 [Pseudomonas syringae pv. maculicola]